MVKVTVRATDAVKVVEQLYGANNDVRTAAFGNRTCTSPVIRHNLVDIQHYFKDHKALRSASNVISKVRSSSVTTVTSCTTTHKRAITRHYPSTLSSLSRQYRVRRVMGFAKVRSSTFHYPQELRDPSSGPSIVVRSHVTFTVINLSMNSTCTVFGHSGED